MLRSSQFTKILCGVSICLLPLACEAPGPPSAAPSPEASLDEQVQIGEIAWFDGSVDEAFALSKEQDRPVYLYWGAVWCPPCQEIKNTVFMSKQFIAQTRMFIPVYLDGDTERAQTWGETFGVKGYPTMIVFNSDREEITRIPGGIDISRYNRVLALSLNHMRPTRMLVSLAQEDPDRLQPSDYQQLAYYSWGQDHNALPEGSSPDLFHELANRVRDSDPEASARLFLQGLVLASESQQTDSAIDQRAGVAHLEVILQSPELVIACWDYLAYWPEEILGVLDLGEAQMDLQTRWQQAVLPLRHHEALSTAEQLGGWIPYLAFYFADDEEADRTLPEEMLAAVRDDAMAADQKTTNAYARQSVVNMISYLYRSAKLNEEARELLMAELERSASPYYFMSGLASLAESEEKVDEALEWRRKAFETSQGNATRFQWGVSYVRALIRLSPEEHKMITETSLNLFGELGDAEEVFLGRNFRYLSTLNGELRAWEQEQAARMPDPADAGQHGKISWLKAFDARLTTLCQEQLSSSIGEQHCSELLEGITSGT